MSTWRARLVRRVVLPVIKKKLNLLTKDNLNDNRKLITKGEKIFSFLYSYSSFPLEEKKQPIEWKGTKLDAEWIISRKVRKEESKAQQSSEESNDFLSRIKYKPQVHQSSNPIILYLHGGAYIMGSSSLYKPFLYIISYLTGLKVLALNYSLAPEAQYPTALREALALYDYLLTVAKLNPKQIILMGDSAGGHLAASMVVSILNSNPDLNTSSTNQLPFPNPSVVPLACILFSPWLDFTSRGESYKKNEKIDSLLTIEKIREVVPFIVPPSLLESLSSPFISPIYCHPSMLQGFPPTLIHVSGSEMLLDDSISFAKLIKEGGKIKNQGAQNDKERKGNENEESKEERRDELREEAKEDIKDLEEGHESGGIKEEGGEGAKSDLVIYRDQEKVGEEIPSPKKPNEVLVKVWNEMSHVWQIFAPFVPESFQSLSDCVSFLKTVREKKT